MTLNIHQLTLLFERIPFLVKDDSQKLLLARFINEPRDKPEINFKTDYKIEHEDLEKKLAVLVCDYPFNPTIDISNDLNDISFNINANKAELMNAFKKIDKEDQGFIKMAQLKEIFYMQNFGLTTR